MFARENHPVNWKLRRRIRTIIILLVLLQGIILSVCQITRPLVAAPVEQAVEPDDVISGHHEMEHVEHLSDEQRSEIEAQLAQNMAMLTTQGKLAMRVNRETAVSLNWPLQQASGFNDYGYHGISFFVDHNGQDYSCDSRIYGGHRGTDFFLWPFEWNKMDDNAVEVISAADGVIIHKQDGNDDRSCSIGGKTWNAVYVQHVDGSVAWYGHLKIGSLTTKNIGETVQAGEYLGIVGSSGNSTGPHLHLEVYDINYNLIDPYQGSCNPLNDTSWWLTQRPYYDSAVNKLTTGTAAPEFNSCPSPEISHEATQFTLDDTVYFSAYFRDRTNSLDSQNTIYRPDNSIFDAWTDTQRSSHRDGSYKSRPVTIGKEEPAGQWRYEVVFNGSTYQHTFQLEETTPNNTDEFIYLPIVTNPKLID
ncbi:MAG: M23 family peptidase [Chloroflexi bacterium]|nr:MAG: M23 family peptidase [Chloroflexota bacterium]